MVANTISPESWYINKPAVSLHKWVIATPLTFVQPSETVVKMKVNCQLEICSIVSNQATVFL